MSAKVKLSCVREYFFAACFVRKVVLSLKLSRICNCVLLSDVKKIRDLFSDLWFNAVYLIPSEVDQIALSTPKTADV